MFAAVKVFCFSIWVHSVCSSVLYTSDGHTSCLCDTKKKPIGISSVANEILEPFHLTWCCKQQGVMKCCTMYELLHKAGNTDYTTTTLALTKPNSPDLTVADTNAPGISMVSFGIGATVGVIIGIIMLFIGCGIAFHYCCQTPVPSGYRSPVITYRQTGVRGRNSQVVSIPFDPDRRESHFNISISYRSTPEQVTHDEPPKYEDVSKVSFPIHIEEQPLTDQDLPTYSSVVERKDP